MKIAIQSSLLVALSAILYGFLGYLGQSVVTSHFSISTMLFWRFAIAGLWLFIFACNKKTLQQFIKLDKKIICSLLIIGAFGYAGSSAFYFEAVKYTGTGIAMVIFFSYPIAIALFSWIENKNNFNKQTLLVLISMFIGLVLLHGFQHAMNMIGIVFGVIAALSYAVYICISKNFSRFRINTTIQSILVCAGCAFMCLLTSASTKSFTFPNTFTLWWHILALGIIATALPIQLMLEGLKNISSIKASIISVLEPLVTLLVGLLLLGEKISHTQWLGVIILLASALVVQFQKESSDATAMKFSEN